MKKIVILTAPLLVLAIYGTSQVTTAQPNCVQQEGPMPACQSGQQITMTNTLLLRDGAWGAQQRQELTNYDGPCHTPS